MTRMSKLTKAEEDRPFYRCSCGSPDCQYDWHYENGPYMPEGKDRGKPITMDEAIAIAAGRTALKERPHE